MALYAEGGHVAKRARVDYSTSPTPITTLQLTAGTTPQNIAAAAATAGILSQQYIEQQLNRRSHEPEKPNHILLFTVLNPTYPITCEVLNTICSPIGSVLRIVIFKKNGVQAMVEFDTVETAKSAKENLHGCDIYSGCCTLKVEFAKPTKLNVYRNDNDSWDYTNPNLGLKPGTGTDGQGGVGNNNALTSQRPVLLKEPLLSTAAAAAASSAAAATAARQAVPVSVAAATQQLTNGSAVNNSNAVAAALAAHNSAALAVNGSSLTAAHSLAAVQQQQQQQAASDAVTYENGFATGSMQIPVTLAGLDTLSAATATTHSQTSTANLSTAATLGRAAAAASLAAGAQQQAAANLMRSAAAPAAAAILTTPLGVPTITSPVTAAGVTAASAAAAAAGQPAAAYQQHQGSVCMVYGLNSEKMNAARIFNLFCLYGNVVRVKFLKTKEGCAMVQMGDALAVERVVTNLNNTPFFGSKMQLGFSKQAFLADVQAPYQLTDGTPSFQDFMGSKNNRFINPEMASKNRIQPPSKILHFFNTPPGLESNDIEDLFTEHGSPKPKCVKLFPSKTERSSSGLIEFETLSEALEALVSCNHQPVPNPNGKFPYIMKLCFSSSRSIPATIR